MVPWWTKSKNFPFMDFFLKDYGWSKWNWYLLLILETKEQTKHEESQTTWMPKSYASGEDWNCWRQLDPVPHRMIFVKNRKSQSDLWCTNVLCILVLILILMSNQNSFGNWNLWPVAENGLAF